MISDESAKELQHDKSIREESLSSEEQGLFEQGKASQDEAETQTKSSDEPKPTILVQQTTLSVEK